jgi:hypothetical protein
MKLDMGFMGSFWEVWEGLRSWREKAKERFLLTFW